jgi:type II secretory pathway component PulK
MVIIMVLGMLIVAVTLSTTFGMDTNALDTFNRQARSKEANYQVARSAFELGLVLLRGDDADVDGAEDLWASGPQEMTWEGRLLRLEVEDEERRFPINALVPDSLPPGEIFKPSEEQDALAKALIRFLDAQGLSGQVATYALVDWMDPDSTPTAGGSEVARDPSIPVKNARLDSLTELTYISNWVQPTGPPPLPLLGGLNAGGELSGGQNATQELETVASDAEDFSDQSGTNKQLNQSVWSDWFSVHSEGKININTAPKEILLSLDEVMTEAMVEEIISKRQEGSLSGEEDLRQIAAIDEDLLFRLGRLIRYNSQYFRVRIRVSSPPGPINIEAVVLRDKKNPKVVRWEVH